MYYIYLFLISILLTQNVYSISLYNGDFVEEKDASNCIVNTWTTLDRYKITTYVGSEKSWYESLRGEADAEAEKTGDVPVYSLIRIVEEGSPYALIKILNFSQHEQNTDSTVEKETEGFFFRYSLEEISWFSYQILDEGELKDQWIKTTGWPFRAYSCDDGTYISYTLYDKTGQEEQGDILISFDVFKNLNYRAVPRNLLGAEDNSIESDDLAPGPRSVEHPLRNETNLDKLISEYESRPTIDKMLSRMWKNKYGSSKGDCAMFVRKGLQHVNFISNWPPENAKDYHELGFLAQEGFIDIFSNEKWKGIIENDLFDVPRGCSVVYKALNPKNDRNGHIGHIENRIVLNKTRGFISDYYSSNPRTGLWCKKVGREITRMKSFQSRKSSPFYHGKHVTVPIKYKKCLSYSNKGTPVSDGWKNREVIGVYCRL